MQPSKLSISDLFQAREQYLIPLFQRGYVWNLPQQIQPLWEDIVDRVEALGEHRANASMVGGAEKLRPLRKHFLGAIVVGAPMGFDSKSVPTREVIDGQQRTTTLQIMLLALRDVIAPLKDEALDYDVRGLTTNPGSYITKSDHLKVWPTNVGRDVMRILFDAQSGDKVARAFPLRGKDGEPLERPLMVQAYLFFHGVLASFLRGKRHDDPVDEADASDGAKTVAQAITRSIQKDLELRVPFSDRLMDAARGQLLVDALQNCFQIMRLQLDEEDDPQIIFETLNARGAPLTPSDLIRNFVFLRASRNGDSVDELYDAYWREFDEKPDGGAAVKSAAKFWKREERQGRLKSNRLDLLFYHYMGLRKCDEVKVAHVFEEFKDWWEAGEPRQIAAELDRLNTLARHFEVYLVPDQKTRFGLFCRRLRLLDTATPVPLLFYLLEHHDSGSADFVQAMADIESYLVRRFICGLTSKSYNRIFIQRLLGELVRRGKSDAVTLRKLMLGLDGPSQRWPGDEEFEQSWLHRQQYEGSNTRRVRAVLEGLELGLRTAKQEFTPELEPLSVEHVLPQKWNAPAYPMSEDSTQARATRWRLMHSIGNLTLVTPGFNSALSNAAFSLKRPEIAANSSLMLNSYFQSLHADVPWNEEAIVERARRLCVTAKLVWPYPSALAPASKSGGIGATADQSNLEVS